MLGLGQPPPRGRQDWTNGSNSATKRHGIFSKSAYFFGARPCEPQRRPKFKSPRFLHVLWLAALLRVTDPRSGCNLKIRPSSSPTPKSRLNERLENARRRCPRTRPRLVFLFFLRQRVVKSHFSDTAFVTPSSCTSVQSLSGLYSFIAAAIREDFSPKFC
jgi:hypothetical protein